MSTLRILFRATLLLVLTVSLFSVAVAQENISQTSKSLYDQLKAFSLTGSAGAQSLVLKKDRAVLKFDGTFYLATSIGGKITGAVFIGDGKFSAELPPSDFEKANLKRLLGAEMIESDFKTAVLRFTDNTADEITKGAPVGAGAIDPRAQKLAAELEGRILKEVGANLSSRLAISILNHEDPSVFFANFDGGKRGRFSLLLDPQSRIPVANFGLNAGEKGLIFKYKSYENENEVWTAFYSLEDYQRRQVSYSDLYDLIDISHYSLDVDLRDHEKKVRLSTQIESQARFANTRAVPFQIGEDLGEYDNQRLRKQMRLKQVRMGQTELAFAQEDWEGGFTVFLPGALQAGEKVSLDLTLEGDFMYDADVELLPDCHYPRSNTSWFPRHGYLDRATFDMRFSHPKRLRVASVGTRVSEQQSTEDNNVVLTNYRMELPVALVTFALARFERHAETIKWEKGGDPIPLEFNSLPGSQARIKEDFILAELSNSVRYFTLTFGKYPYASFGAAFHPFNFGQGFPTMLMIPPTDRASKYTYVFIAHETAHQWWGNIVAWRSYRDQWLSEGFAEYSGILYTAVREGTGARDDLLGGLRRSLNNPPLTETGLGKGRLVDVGPIILGQRLSTRKTQGAYQTLIYNKGALVLRMLHFLLTDPTSGDDKPFFDMMTDFVNRYRNQAASTDDFRLVANEHFARTPIARLYRINNLDWFFDQWVYSADMPSYHMQYKLENQPDGKVLLSGTVTQEHVPANWFMVLPVVISFGGQQEARGTVHAYGPSATFQIKLPARPKRVELDPKHWVISQETSTSSN